MKKVLYILGELDDDDIEWLIRVGTKVRLSPPSVLIEENKPIDSFFIVIEGSFGIHKKALNNQRVAQSGAGEVLGEMSFVDSRPPSATVIAEESALVLSVPRHVLSDKLKQDTRFAAHFYRAISIFLADRLRDVVGQFDPDSADDHDDDALEDDELNLDQLGNASKGGIRFDQILKRLKEL